MGRVGTKGSILHYPRYILKPPTKYYVARRSVTLEKDKLTKGRRIIILTCTMND